jgi:hypothetical protein
MKAGDHHALNKLVAGTTPVVSCGDANVSVHG